MNALKRLQELSARCELTPQGYKTDLTKAEMIEYRALNTIKNILTSQTGQSFMDRDVALYLAKKWRSMCVILRRASFTTR